MGPNTPIKSFSKKILFIISGVIIFSCFIFMFLNIKMLNSSEIYPNIYIENINIGELTPNAAKHKVKQVFEKQLESFNIGLTYDDKTWNFSYEDIGLYYVFDDYISKAYGIGRSGNYYERIKKIYSLKKNPEIIKLDPYYDSDEIDNIIGLVSQTINKDPINAKIVRKDNEFIITKEILGVEVRKNDLKKEIISNIKKLNNSLINIPTYNSSPQVLEKDLIVIQDLIGEYSTTFNSAVSGRSENIKLASNSINNTLLMPDEEFSFNKSTGPRSVEAGYKEAPVIISGELVPDTGGGVCQVSTTLYQAAVRSDLEIIARRNHGLPVNYVPLGQDATVAYGYIDFKFKNNKNHPIYIESFIKGNRLFVKIHSKKLDNISIDLESEVVEVIDPKIEVKKDKNMYLNEKKIIKEPKKGYRVITYKIYKEEGKEIKREKITKDYYPPKDGIIVEGISKL